MPRIQVQLAEQQLARLRRISAEKGQSVAELVRLGVELYLNSQQKPDMRVLRERARLAAGTFSAGPPHDVSERHDDYLAEAFLDW